MADYDERPTVTDKPKKRLVKGRKRELQRDERLKNHVTGPPCNCSKLKCFEVTSVDDRERVIAHLNNLKTKDEQDALLGSLISVQPVKRRRSRKEDPTEAEFHQKSFFYQMSIVREGSATQVNVCIKAFLSIFDVSENRVRRIREKLATTGKTANPRFLLL
jgi:hypothetical protein